MDRFTGILNNVYPVKDGVVMYPENSKPAVLIKHYGAMPLEDYNAGKKMAEEKAAAEKKAAEAEAKKVALAAEAEAKRIAEEAAKKK